MAGKRWEGGRREDGGEEQLTSGRRARKLDADVSLVTGRQEEGKRGEELGQSME